MPVAAKYLGLLVSRAYEAFRLGGELESAERLYFEWLGIFSGAWTLTAAEAVCRAEGSEVPELLDVITGLVDKSLLQGQIGVTPEARFRMLQTVRDYALERLSQSPDVDQVRRRQRRDPLKQGR